MKILVTGGAGFIGTNLIKRLLSAGHDVYSIDNYDSGLTSNHQPGCKYVNDDIETLEYFKGNDFDLVYHLAAFSRIQPSFENPTETFRVNVRGSEVVAEWAIHNNVKVVYAGSSSKHHDLTISPYDMYKYLGEEIFKLYKTTYDLDVDICRFNNVYGPGELVDGDHASVIGKWRRQVQDGLPITIVGRGEQRRDFTHVVDIVDALYKVGSNIVHYNNNKNNVATWELGTGINYSINELYKMFKEKYGTECTYIPEQKGNSRITLRANNDALDRLHWKPEDRLNDYIKSLKL